MFFQDLSNIYDMFFLLISSDLWSYRLDLTSRLFISVELSFSCFFSAYVFFIWFMEDASASLEYAEGEGTSKTKYYAYFPHVHGSFKFFLEANHIIFSFLLLFQVGFGEKLFLSFKYGFHAGEILLGYFGLFVEMLVEFILDEILSETAFVVVEGRVDHGSVDEYYLIAICAFVENSSFVLDLLVEIFISKVKLIDFDPVLSQFFVFFESVQWNLLDIYFNLRH